MPRREKDRSESRQRRTRDRKEPEALLEQEPEASAEQTGTKEDRKATGSASEGSAPRTEPHRRTRRRARRRKGSSSGERPSARESVTRASATAASAAPGAVEEELPSEQPAPAEEPAPGSDEAAAGAAPAAAAPPERGLALDDDDTAPLPIRSAEALAWEQAPLPGAAQPQPKAQTAPVACFNVAAEQKTEGGGRLPRFAGWYAQSAVTGKFRPTDARQQGVAKAPLGESLTRRRDDPERYPEYLRTHLEWARIFFSHLRAVVAGLTVLQYYTLIEGLELNLFLSRYVTMSDTMQKLYNALAGTCLALALLSFGVQSAACIDAEAVTTRRQGPALDLGQDPQLLRPARRSRWLLGVYVFVYIGVMFCSLGTAAFDDWIWEFKVDLQLRTLYPNPDDRPTKLRDLPPLDVADGDKCDEWISGYGISTAMPTPEVSLHTDTAANISTKEHCLQLCDRDEACDAVTHVRSGPLAENCYLHRISDVDRPIYITGDFGRLLYIDPALHTPATVAAMDSYMRCGCYALGVRYVQMGPMGATRPGCGNVRWGTVRVHRDGEIKHVQEGCVTGMHYSRCRSQCTHGSSGQCKAFQWDPYRGMCRLMAADEAAPTQRHSPPHHKQLFCARHDCGDTEAWVNADGETCDAYFRNGWCAQGRFVSGFEKGAPGYRHPTCEVRGSDTCAQLHNGPAENCCECGKGRPPGPLPPLRVELPAAETAAPSAPPTALDLGVRRLAQPLQQQQQDGTPVFGTPLRTLAPAPRPPDIARYCLNWPEDRVEFSQPHYWSHPSALQWFDNRTGGNPGADFWEWQMRWMGTCRARGCCYCPDCDAPGLQDLNDNRSQCYYPPVDPVHVETGPRVGYSEAAEECAAMDRQLCYAADICDYPEVLGALDAEGALQGWHFSPVGDGDNEWVQIGANSDRCRPGTPRVAAGWGGARVHWWGDVELDLPHRGHVFCCRSCPRWERPAARQLADRFETFRVFSMLRMAFALAGCAYGVLAELFTVPPNPGDADSDPDVSQSAQSLGQKRDPSPRHPRQSGLPRDDGRGAAV
eukprot:TRINITY_DN47244_c0_g1_i1.p1 TRINITY_DN47244_c0_g1~~TRINITY_DN47244_c0_g1_i1.p1  ORF type:complete len:1044 (+),score=209.54 TRINITY_DN47244_c0_g1_i1:81-3212(+)